ncbi:MAG: DUF2252 domain-containing protein [Deltaproteobacteria bacterium]|nr:DUF2252 domain-containing protein [Deltaproteobacteria bacterium]
MQQLDGEVKIKPERLEAGRALRKDVPRSAHSAWTPHKKRDPIGILEQQADAREKGLTPIRYQRMAQSPFAFFRGGAAIMAEDLAHTPDTGLRVQTCGDAHVANFGKFATPERRLVFDINDFDETLPGPWEWDVKRLCASMHIAAREHGFSKARCDRIVLNTVRAYRERLAEYSHVRTLDLWYDRIRVKDVIAHFNAKYRPTLRRAVKKAKRKTHLRAVARLTKGGKGLRFVEDPPLQVHLSKTGRNLDDARQMLEDYRKTLREDRRFLFDRYELVDVARKVVGVGSVGTRCWIALLEAADHPLGDRMVLQIKEAQASVLEPYVGASARGHHGRRVVTGQWLIQGASDMMLGWCTAPKTGRHYYVRQLWDVKGAGDLTSMNFENMALYGALCAWALARAHARTGDAAEISGYLGGGPVFDHSIVEFSATYAETNARDHESLKQAIASKRLRAHA